MKLWLISQEVNRTYNTFDSAVVAADTENEARLIHPSSDCDWTSCVWCWSPDQVAVKLLGEAAEGVTHGVILASFNAG